MENKRMETLINTNCIYKGGLQNEDGKGQEKI